MSELYVPKVGVLASGSGTTAHAYARAIHEGIINHEIQFVVSNKPTAIVLDKAAAWNKDWGFDVETAVINSKTHERGPRLRGQTEEEAEAICEIAEKNRVDLILALGYMIIINDPMIDTYGYVRERHASMFSARLINTHPAPLPLTADTYGVEASAKALAAYLSGEITESKHTVHLVEQGVDKGPIIVEHPVPILEGDTAEILNQRTQLVEKATIAYAVDKFVREQQEYLRAA